MTFDSVVTTFGRVRRQGLLTALALAVAAGIGGGCSSVPDAMNPVEWYKGTRDWIVGEDGKETAKADQAKPVPGADKPFPQLNTVPDRPPKTTEAERKQMASGLVADRKAARYTDETIRRQTSAVASGSSPATTSRTMPEAMPQPPQLGASAQARRGPAVMNQTASAAPAPQRDATPPPLSAIPQTPAAPPPPPAISSVITAGQPVPVAPAPSYPPAPLPGAEMQSQAVAGLPGNVRVTRSHQRTAAVAPDRFSTRFPSGATAVQGPYYSLPPELNVSPSAGFAPGAIIPPSAGLSARASLVPAGKPAATVRFGVGSAKIGAQGRRLINRAYQAYKSQGGRIYVVGHASSRTRNLNRARHELANFRVSYDRARAVARELARMGVDPAAIVVSAVSDQQPAFFEVMPAGEAGNRRAEIFFAN